MTAVTHRSGESLINDLFPNSRLQFIHGNTMTVALWEFDEGVEVAAHEHPHEQITHCVDGNLEVTVDGKMIVLGPGDSVVIPGRVEHAARATTSARGIDAFHPVRADYRR
jgi:quercetin dioxygenase-like cupin family protein